MDIENISSEEMKSINDRFQRLESELENLDISLMNIINRIDGENSFDESKEILKEFDQLKELINSI